MHVVQVGQAEPPGQPHAEQAGFLVGVDGVVAAGACQPGRGDGQQGVEQELGGGGSDADAAQERRPGAADDLEARRLDAVVLAEGGPARLEEQLGGEHQETGGGGRAREDRAEGRSSRPGI